MPKWTFSEDNQKTVNADIEQLKIFDLPKKPLYHYTSREAFWKIMESETFLARHIMFSNDYEENKIGTQKIHKAMEAVGIKPREADSLPFMICFCEQEDLLSQWRGYAREGVALEFDFTKGLYGLEEAFSSYNCFTIMNNEENKAKSKFLSEELRADGKESDDKIFVGAIASPYAVIYTESGDAVDEVIQNKMTLIASQPEDSRQQYAVGMIPFIKNKKFDEEQEYRLVFDMKQLVPESQQYLLQKKYFYQDAGGIKRPNIIVRFGDQSRAEEDVEIALYYVNDGWTDILQRLRKELKTEGVNIKLVLKKRKYRTGQDEIVVSEGKHQEVVCVRLREMMRQLTPPVQGLKIWCDGHLPLRRIIVGPSPDAELMKSSIEEYLKTKYWMRDIKVDLSVIPLRT